MSKMLKIFFFLAIVAEAAAQKTLTLRECVALLTKNNLTYRDSRLQAESATAQLQQAQSQRLPQLGFSAGQNLNFGRSIDRFTNNYIDEIFSTNFLGINAQIPVFQGFQIQHQVQQSSSLRHATLKNQEAIFNQQVMVLLQGYVSALATNALYEAAQEQVLSSKLQVKRVEKQVAAGIVGQNVLFEIKAQLANDEFDAVTARNNYLQARLRLFQIINVLPDDAVGLEALPAQTLPNFASAAAIYEDAVKTFPEIKSGELRLQSFGSQIKAIKAANLPSLNLSGNFGAFYASSNPERGYFKQLDAKLNAPLRVPRSEERRVGKEC